MNAVVEYRDVPGFAAEFIAALPGFGAAPDLTQWAESYASYHAGRCHWDAQFVGKGSPKRCLNIGGAPYIFEFALKKGFPHIDVTTVDIDPERFPGAASVIGMRTMRANIETTERLMDEKFDIIVFTEIFEHLRIDILGTVSRLRDLLAENGRLYLTMPNGLGLNAWRKRLLKGRTGPSVVEEWSKLSRLGHMGHVREYSMIELTEVLSHCGFTIEDSRYRVHRTGPWPMRDLLLKYRPQFGDEILIVARKAANGT